jgi:ankyrin repeat protein
MSLIIKALRQGNPQYAYRLIQQALPYEICLRDEGGQTALHIAVQKNYLEIVKCLLDKGAQINAQANDNGYTYMTPLHYAALTGNLAATQLLLVYGANTLIENGHFHTAPIVAYQHGFVEVARTIERHDSKNISQREIESSLDRKKLELQNSSIHTLETRTWLLQRSKPANNIIDFKKRKNRKS